MSSAVPNGREPGPLELATALADRPWLVTATARIAADPSLIRRYFPAAGRECGRDRVARAPRWTADDAARAVLLTTLPLTGAALVAEVTALYQFGDADEKRAVLRTLPWLAVGSSCVDLLRDALRSNDTRLVAAALGPYARHLDDAAWRHGVLKCVFMSIPLDLVDRLTERADAELAAMISGLAQERSAAGRDLPPDAATLLQRLTH
jgi:L-ribulose-5-phosphate 3-epimerase